MSILKADKILRPDGETLLDTTGSVLQVISDTETNFASSTSSSYVQMSNYYVDITLNHADNQVIIMGGFYGSTGGSYNRVEYVLYRGSTAIGLPTSQSNAGRCMGKILYLSNNRRVMYHPFVYMDTPGSVGSHRYAIRMRDGNADTTFYFNRAPSQDSSSTNCVSTIVAMEVKA